MQNSASEKGDRPGGPPSLLYDHSRPPDNGTRYRLDELRRLLGCRNPEAIELPHLARFGRPDDETPVAIVDADGSGRERNFAASQACGFDVGGPAVMTTRAAVPRSLLDA